MRNSRKLAAAAFVVSLSLAALAPVTVQAATTQARASEPGPGGFLRRLIKEIQHALGFSTHEEVVSVPKP